MVVPPELMVEPAEWLVGVLVAPIRGVRIGQRCLVDRRQLEPLQREGPRMLLQGHLKLRADMCMELCGYLQEEMQIQEVLREAKDIQSQNGGTSGAEFLHEHISADRWGITAASLRSFEFVVRKKWSEGQMQNTGRVSYDRAKFDDENIGPNMYQVNDQIIKPETADPQLILPGVSWALCDCLAGHAVTHFVSHAWAEGIFEFCRLLFQRWSETEGTSAYICFLSNPQNLDIGSFLATIETSPFYVALQKMPSSGQMIMVATTNCSIHTRLWCVFEAYVAMDCGIPVLLSGSPANLARRPSTVVRQRGIIAAFTDGNVDLWNCPCVLGEGSNREVERNSEQEMAAEVMSCRKFCVELNSAWLCWLTISVLFFFLLRFLASWVLSGHGANSVSVRLTVGIIILYSVFTLSICLRSCQLCAYNKPQCQGNSWMFELPCVVMKQMPRASEGTLQATRIKSTPCWVTASWRLQGLSPPSPTPTLAPPTPTRDHVTRLYPNGIRAFRSREFQCFN